MEPISHYQTLQIDAMRQELEKRSVLREEHGQKVLEYEQAAIDLNFRFVYTLVQKEAACISITGCINGYFPVYLDKDGRIFVRVTTTYIGVDIFLQTRSAGNDP